MAKIGSVSFASTSLLLLSASESVTDALTRIKKNVKIDYVKDPSTLRRHLERHHKPQYLAWAKREGFPSMLPSDTAARKHKLEAEKAAQSTLDDHLAPRPERTKVVRYTPEIFEDASIKYAMTNKYFQEMIDVASCATDGVVIPLRKAVRGAILRMFQQNLVKLKNHLNVSFISTTSAHEYLYIIAQSANVPGQVELSCDAWQVDNMDAYFVSTGSFIEIIKAMWRKRTAILGFVRLQNAHNGKRLGQALYRIVARLGIAHKVCYFL
ncbi:hypothetical protein DFH09DRAFT_913347 [Mycena vulgaris]|nr:hypothetical protein DFH09DRAFT_913347 [Mycena vulgaris]